MKILKQTDCIGYVMANLSKYVEISMQTSLDYFLQKVFWKRKRAKIPN